MESVMHGLKSKFFDWKQSTFLLRIASLRIEEFIAYFFFIPSMAITLRANVFFWLEDFGMGRRIGSGIWRLLLVTILLALIPFLSRRSEKSRFYLVVRNALPFVIAIAIYTNLHDTIHFVNPNDVQHWFLRADIWLFGVEPTIWAQQFYKPWLTELLSFCYAAYLPLTILIPLILYLRRKDLEARKTLLGIVFCFYCGYIFYILFPAVPPRLAIANLYTHDFEGSYLLQAQRAMVSISESSSRAAFPSLHIAITILTLTYAFRFVRKLFWFLLPLGIGLLTATIYLRHHYAVDLIAGVPLSIFAYHYSPVIDKRWESFRNKVLASRVNTSG